MRLADEVRAAWTQLAQGPLGIELRASTEPADRDLDENLAHLRSEYSDPAFSARFLERPELHAESRARQWAHSRSCLVLALKQIPAGSGLIRASLSHCEPASIAVACAAPALLGVGVDLEASDRVISPAAAKRIVFESELKQGISALEAWVIKEACYKADPGNDSTIIADYIVEQKSRARSSKNARIFFKFDLRRQNGLLVAFACAFAR